MSAGRLRMLLVEDDEVDRIAFRRFLRERDLPYDCVVANSVAAARVELATRRFDVVVADYLLGDGTAFDVLAMTRAVPVVFITGSGNEQVAVKALKSGAADYITKDPGRGYLDVLPTTVENAVRRMHIVEQVWKLTHAVEQSPVMVAILDDRLRVEYVNNRFSEMTGFEAGEVLGQEPWFLRAGEHDPGFYAGIRQTLREGQAWEGEVRSRKKSGERFWEWVSASPLRNADGVIAHYTVIEEDISERKRTEEEREHLIGELDSFAHTVAHDLKSPLTAVLGLCQLLGDGAAKLEEGEQGECLHQVALSAKRMQNIVDELLLLATVRQTQVEYEELAMDELVENAWARLRSLIEERGPELVRCRNWPRAVGHGPWVEEVWTNYLGNAIQYGGRPPRLELGADEKDGRARFWVRDNGPGISAAEQARLFVPFTRLHQARVAGHGLGLSIVRRIMERLGGEAWVESEPGRGSKFGFTLPRAPGG